MECREVHGAFLLRFTRGAARPSLSLSKASASAGRLNRFCSKTFLVIVPYLVTSSQSPITRAAVLLATFLLSLAVQVPTLWHDRDLPPHIGDAVENYNLAWNLAHGHGYAFDWDQPAMRARFDDPVLLARHGAGPTACRPPLVPLLGTPLLWIAPQHPFLAMRIVDAILLTSAALLITACGLSRGLVAGAIAGALCAADPLHWVVLRDVWMTEPISTFLLATLVATWTRDKPSLAVIMGSSLIIGLLMLARGSFVPIMPGLVLITAWRFGLSLRRGAIVIVLISCLVPLAWWIRNCYVLKAFMPLGTQAGINLPDEYSNAAVESGGVWSGRGLRDVWAKHWGDEALLPYLGSEGFPPPEQLRPLWAGDDAGYGWMVYSLVTGHIDLERETARAGQWAGIGWILDHPLHVPGLMLAKAWNELSPLWISLLPALAAGVTLIFTRHDPLVRSVWWLLAFGVIAVMLTHSVGGRFLSPYAPALYLLSGVGISVLLRPNQTVLA